MPEKPINGREADLSEEDMQREQLGHVVYRERKVRRK